MALSVLGLALAYLLGAIPVGYLIARTAAGLDIRRHGSGNVGATNVLRTLGTIPAAVTLFGDAVKGWGAVWLAGGLGGPEPAWAAAGAVFAVIGHCWSVFLRFTGGKGVATGLGAFLGLAPRAAVLTLPVWVVIAATFRYVSLASMVAAGCLPFGVFLLGYPAASALAALAAAIVVVARHRENLVRLLAGNELKLGARLPGS